MAIAKERHQENEEEEEEFHLHCLIRLNRKCNIRKEDYFDFDDQHPNIQSARNWKDVYNYIQKEKVDYVEFGSWEEVDDVIKAEVLECTGRKQVMDCMIRHKKIHQHKFWLEYWLLSGMEVGDEEVKYDLDDFDVPIAVREWMDDHDNKSLILVGDAGGGKTSLARAVAARLGDFHWNPHKESIKSYRQQGTIIFDDTDFGNCGRTTLLNYLDTEHSREFNIKFSSVTIRAGVRRIFTTNSLEFLLGEHRYRPEVQRRIRVVECGRLYEPPLRRAEEMPPRLVSLGNQRRSQGTN